MEQSWYFIVTALLLSIILIVAFYKLKNAHGATWIELESHYKVQSKSLRKFLLILSYILIGGSISLIFSIDVNNHLAFIPVILICLFIVTFLTPSKLYLESDGLRIPSGKKIKWIEIKEYVIQRNSDLILKLESGKQKNIKGLKKSDSEKIISCLTNNKVNGK